MNTNYEEKVRNVLSDTLPGEQTNNWLRAKNTLLDRQRPCVLLAEGRGAEVLSAAERYVDGDPL